jgi:hypothetical protein
VTSVTSKAELRPSVCGEAGPASPDTLSGRHGPVPADLPPGSGRGRSAAPGAGKYPVIPLDSPKGHTVIPDVRFGRRTSR